MNFINKNTANVLLTFSFGGMIGLFYAYYRYEPTGPTSSIFFIVALSFLFALYIGCNIILAQEDEQKQVKEEINRYINILPKEESDVLSLMIKNVAELREYYVINKRQANSSFRAALFISVLGFALFSVGLVVSYYTPEKFNVIPYSTIGGVIVEIIAGLFFWLYSKAVTQLNLFHASLQSTEKFLTAIQLVSKMSIEERRDEAYKEIISQIISYNFSLNREKSSV